MIASKFKNRTPRTDFRSLDTRRKRGAFFRFMTENYSIDMQKVYRKMSKGVLEPWEHKGLIGCIREFAADDSIGDIYAWYNSLPERRGGDASAADGIEVRRMAFYEFMQPQGLSRDTITKHFQLHDWTDIQIMGWDAAWVRFQNLDKEK